MFIQIINLILSVVVGIVAGACLLRCYMQWFGSQLGAEQRKLIGVYLFPLTNWIVIPLRRIIPSIGLLDAASLLAAYLLVFGKVAIDLLPGPSEVLVIADKTANADWIAADLLSQAEHDESAQSILITDNADFGRAVMAAVETRLETLARRDIAGASWRDYGAVIVVPSLTVAAQLSDRLAPEHLELCVADPDALAAQITHAGAIFLGAWTPEAIGDYVGGPNHVLPTARSARFSSGLSVMDFIKRTTLSKMTPAALGLIGPAAERLALSESLEAHSLSVTARLTKLNR